MENTCSVCRGDGLVGVGENPHLKEGNISTCSVCAGTGKSVSSEVTASAPVEPTPEIPAFGEKICEICGCKMAGPGVTSDMECAEIANHPKKNEDFTPESESSFHE